MLSCASYSIQTCILSNGQVETRTSWVHQIHDISYVRTICTWRISISIWLSNLSSVGNTMIPDRKLQSRRSEARSGVAESGCEALRSALGSTRGMDAKRISMCNAKHSWRMSVNCVFLACASTHMKVGIPATGRQANLIVRTHAACGFQRSEPSSSNTARRLQEVHVLLFAEDPNVATSTLRYSQLTLSSFKRSRRRTQGC